MGMFGNLGLQDTAAFFNPGPSWQMPGIGDGVPGNRRIDGTMVPFPNSGMNGRIPVMEGMPAPRKPGFFGAGGKGWNILGTLGDALQVAGGGQATYAAQQRWREEQDRAEALKIAEIQARANKAQMPSDFERKVLLYKQYNPNASDAEIGNMIKMNITRPITIGGDLYDPTSLGGGEQQPALQPGYVEDGYRYNGGDPANPNSWSKM